MKKKDKNGIGFVFTENPELINIGTKEQYEEYLKTIFPERKIQNIAYHQTPRKFEKFDINKSRTEGIYFSPFNLRSGIFVKDYTKAALLNIKNPFIISKKQNREFERYLPNLSKLSKKVDLKDYDGIIGFSNVYYDKGQLDSEVLNISPELKNNIEFVVFNPEQIHVLGSQEDITKFKEFVNKQKENSLENKVISSLFIFSFLAGIVLTTFNLTGNIIGISAAGGKLLGIILFLIGISGFFIYRKLRS